MGPFFIVRTMYPSTGVGVITCSNSPDCRCTDSSVSGRHYQSGYGGSGEGCVLSPGATLPTASSLSATETGEGEWWVWEGSGRDLGEG